MTIDPPGARPAPPVPLPARRDAAYDAAFQPREEWSGADGTYSFPLGDGRTAWMFSDTLIGGVTPDGRRSPDTRMVHNSFAVQQGGDPATVRFLNGGADVFQPPDGRGWFWVYHAAPAPAAGHHTVMLGQFEATRAGDMFSFHQVGNWTADLAVGPDAVTVSDYRPIPHFREQHGPSPAIAFGAALLDDGDWTYIYGTRDFTSRKDLLVARAPRGHAQDADLWTFHSGGGWSPRVEDARPIHDNVANELSVHRAGPGDYVLTTQSGGVGADILLLHASSPVGPFGNPHLAWTAPEHDARTMAYNAKAHPELSGPGLLVSYNVNAYHADDLMADPSIYHPRFVRVETPTQVPPVTTNRQVPAASNTTSVTEMPGMMS